MKLTIAVVLAGVGLALTSTAAPAAQTDDAKGDVVYTDAMECSSLYSVMSTYAEDEAIANELIDAAARWLLIAMNRNGTDDFEVATQDLTQRVNSLTAELDAQADDEERQALLFGGIDECEAIREAIADEFDSIDLG